jgi:hypothetical protein
MEMDSSNTITSTSSGDDKDKDRPTALKDIVEEGIDARNVLSWRVPNEPSPQGKSRTSSGTKKKKKPHTGREFVVPSSGGSTSTTSTSSSIHHRMNALSMYETASASDTQSEDSRTHFQSRLWRFLFSNITRAVDELYNLCEDENNREYCMEGIKMFDRCTNDFNKLIERMEDQKRFQEGGQVGGVSWEVRKTSSGKRRVLSSSSSVGNVIIHYRKSGTSLTITNSVKTTPSSYCLLTWLLYTQSVYD